MVIICRPPNPFRAPKKLNVLLTETIVHQHMVGFKFHHIKPYTDVWGEIASNEFNVR